MGAQSNLQFLSTFNTLVLIKMGFIERGFPDASVSEGAVERETPHRQRISFDSDRGSSTSPCPSKYPFVVGGSRTLIQGYCVAAHIPHVKHYPMSHSNRE